MGKRESRIHSLTEILQNKGFVSIKELSKHFHVSEMTIRRDLIVLKKNHVAENVGGIAFYRPSSSYSLNDPDYNLSEELVKQNIQKDNIGRFAASLIDKDDIVIIDTGTTTEKIAPYIPENQNITVLCYSTNILQELHPKTSIHLLFAGGFYHPKTQMFESSQGISFIQSIRAKKVFISAAGIHPELGITCVNSYEVPTKHAILKSSLQKILVADSSKFDKIRPAYFCDLQQINTVITDDGISPHWMDFMESEGIQIHIVPSVK